MDTGDSESQLGLNAAEIFQDHNYSKPQVRQQKTQDLGKPKRAKSKFLENNQQHCGASNLERQTIEVEGHRPQQPLKDAHQSPILHDRLTSNRESSTSANTKATIARGPKSATTATLPFVDQNDSEVEVNPLSSISADNSIESVAAVNFVDAVKARGLGKEFFEIVNKFHKSVVFMKFNSANFFPNFPSYWAELQMFDQLSDLLRNHTDLLSQFSKFLPGRSCKQNGLNPIPTFMRASHTTSFYVKKSPNGFKEDGGEMGNGSCNHEDYSFFDRLRDSLKDQQQVYNNILRSIKLLTDGLLSSAEFLHLVSPSLQEFPVLYEVLKAFVSQIPDAPSFTPVRTQRTPTPSPPPPPTPRIVFVPPRLHPPSLTGAATKGQKKKQLQKGHSRKRLRTK